VKRKTALMMAALCCALAGTAAAQEYPQKPIRLIIPFAPGGSNDIIGRLFAARITETLGQQVIPDNRGGAGGSIGAELAAKAPPDGYTLVIGHIGTLAVNPTLYRKLAYNPTTDFAPISTIAKVANIMVVHPSVPAKSVSDLIRPPTSRPGTLTYGSGGTGGAGHLATEYFKLMAKVDVIHVPYKGTGPALVDLIAGQTHLVFAGVPAIIPHVKSGRLRPLGVSTGKRLAVFPDVPTIAEAGVAGYEATQWYGVLAPAGTPAPIVGKLNKEIAKWVETPQMLDRLAADGSEPFITTPEAFLAFIKSETARWAPVIKSAGIVVN
jgi:tripartite-type tricarboxylate transporter receptor subunit TctC